MSQKKGGFRATWIFTGFVVLLAAYSAWEFHRTGPDNDTATEKHLFKFETEQVEELKITGKDENLDIVREPDGWKVKSPYQDLGDPSAIEAVLYSIQIQKGRSFRGDGEIKKIIWADFGLDPVGTKVEVRTKKDTQTLALGSKNAFDGSFYLRQGDELMLGDKSMAQAVLRDPKTYRSRQLWRDPDEEVTSVEVQLDKQSYKIVKNGEGWGLDPAPPFPIDKNRISKWTATLQQIQPAEVADEKVTEENKRADLLLKPSMVITVKGKKPDGKPSPDWILTLGQNKDEDVYLYLNQRPTLYKTTAAALASLRVGPEYFRDGHVPFHFNAENAREVEVHSGDFKHTFSKSDLVWKIKDEPSLELDQDKLIALMQQIGTFNAAEFVPIKSAKGFKPDQRIVIRDGVGKILFDLSLGDYYKAQMPYNKGQSMRFVKTNLETREAMGIVGTKLNELVDKTMVHPKAEHK